MRLGLKVMLIGLVMCVLLIPLLLLHGLVHERKMRAAEVVADVAASSSRAQRIVGPLLLLEVEREEAQRRLVLEAGVQREVVETKPVRELRLVLPESLDIKSSFGSEHRGRALFQALLYHLDLKAEAKFDARSELKDGERLLGARLLLGLGDNRGIQRIKITASGHELGVEPGAVVPWLGNGVHAALRAERASTLMQVALDLRLSGTEALDFVPVAAETAVSVEGDWPHPSFRGDLLPQAPILREQGFSAAWSVSRLASQAQQLLSNCGTHNSHCALESVAFGLRLVDPVDRYLMTERAMKYALLVLVLVFGAVFFIEVVGRAELHALHYGLVGLALAMFFLLLLALSEHIGFALAYLLAAAACTGLIASYLAGVLDSRLRGAAAGALLGLLYAILYGLLKAEDYALLMGAVTLFGCLALFMLATRRVRWAPLTYSSRMG
jgi:inner membrane protein